MARNRSATPPLDATRQSVSPPPQKHSSRREQRKAILTERLNELTASFNANMRPHYDAQAAAIQMNIQLILRADAYQNKPLEDDPEQISKLTHEAVRDQLPAVAEGDFVAVAGKMYSEFVNKVNDAMEERDIALTQLAVSGQFSVAFEFGKDGINANDLQAKYHNSMSELFSRYQFQVKLAQEEHRYLADTIRERLVQSVGKRRERLLKEKEQLDIGDSNALMLHPNQFSIANPASPGAGAKRATRHAGKRAGADPDDPSSLLDKRKRRYLFDETDTQSPAPMPSRMEYGGASPFRDGRSKNAYHQYEAPVYSIDRLFTEKELSMAMNRAAIAATNFLVRLRQNNEQSNGNGPSAAALDAEDAPNLQNLLVPDAEMDDTGTPAAADMERTVSQSYHATRGATRSLLNDLATAATRDVPFGTATPMYVPAVMGTKANSAPVSAAPATQSEIEQDLIAMQRETNYDDLYNNKLLERASAAMPPVEYQYRPPAAAHDNQDAPPGILPHLLGGIPMSNQNSVGGQSEVVGGGVPMSRTGSALGGAGMKRTASATSLFGVSDTVRRVRARP